MQQESFFASRAAADPLASRVRPRSLEEFVGQRHLLAEGKVLRYLIDHDQVSSMIFWGPPGVGKTTLARIIAQKTKADVIDFSAVTSGIVLIGATTENPSFEINAALLSRCKVFVLQALSADDLIQLLKNALRDERGFGEQTVQIEEDMLRMIAVFANGDARTALGTLEMVVLNGEKDGGVTTVTRDILEQCISKKSLLYDKNGEEHYNIISALHKSMRNSDVDAAIYWLARMLEAGEDPLYVARRLIRFASEDVGMADSRALEVAVLAYQACHFIGMPECNVTLTHAVTYLALAPKSNALYRAYEAAKRDAQEMLAEPVPLQIRNAPTALMKDLHYGEGYVYAHDTEEKLSAMQCLPDALLDRRYYIPTTQGSEARAKERLERIAAWKREHREKA